MSYDVFRPGDLLALEALYEKGVVVAMEDVVGGDTGRDVIGLRHDVDHSIDNALKMARWEAHRGYRSTYFLLHTAPYWGPWMRDAVDELVALGHEIGFHTNAVTEAMRTGRDPVEITALELDLLRSFGHPVRGVVAHGDPDCYGPGRELRVVNDEMFVEGRRPEMGEPDRIVKGTSFRLDPVPMSMFDLEYDPNRLPRAEYLSDSGGRWSKPFPGVAYDFPYPDGQLHMLVHPDWWGGALA